MGAAGVSRATREGRIGEVEPPAKAHRSERTGAPCGQQLDSRRNTSPAAPDGQPGGPAPTRPASGARPASRAEPRGPSGDGPRIGAVDLDPTGRLVVQRQAGPPVIQRHASYEHRLLGDVPPDALFALGAQSELAGQDGDDYVVHGPTGDETVARDNVVHILDQELRRLKAWQVNEPKLTSMYDIGGKTGRFKAVVEQAAKENHDTDSDWNVRIVAIPSTAKGGTPLLVTYGELNTLADFYGSVEELKAADPAKRRNVVQSVRHQSYTELRKIYQKVATSVEAKRGLADLGDAPAFAGSFNITGATGEINQMGTDRKGGSGTTMYMATLARNACHFAPESWHSWEDHHHKALTLARDAHAEQDGKKKDAMLNEALLVNGFGDHYLQDSYAAGHLINKTKIMQMYVRHLDRNPPVTSGYTTDPTWRAFQSMAYNQDGLTDDRQYDKSRIGRRDIGGQQVTTAQNPQAVENTQSLGQNFNWQDRFKMLGLSCAHRRQARDAGVEAAGVDAKAARRLAHHPLRGELRRQGAAGQGSRNRHLQVGCQRRHPKPARRQHHL